MYLGSKTGKHGDKLKNREKQRKDYRISKPDEKEKEEKTYAISYGKQRRNKL